MDLMAERTETERTEETRLLIPGWAIGRGEVPVEELLDGD